MTTLALVAIQPRKLTPKLTSQAGSWLGHSLPHLLVLLAYLRHRHDSPLILENRRESIASLGPRVATAISLVDEQQRVVIFEAGWKASSVSFRI